MTGDVRKVVEEKRVSPSGTAHTVAELARLGELIDNIYQGATEPDRWNTILPKIADWVSARFGLLFTPMHTPEKGGFYFNHGIPESVMHLWSTRWQGEDILTNTVVERGLFVEGTVLLGEDVVPFEQMQQAPIWRELNHPNQIDHFLGGTVFDYSSSIGLPTALMFYRSVREGPFTAEERDRLLIVMPHVSRAFGVMAKLREADLKISANLAAIDRIASGVLLFNAQGAVTFANRAARRILQDEDGLQLRHRQGSSSLGDLAAGNRRTQDDLFRAIEGAINPDILNTAHFSRAVLVPRSSGRQEYMLNFSRLAAHSEFGIGTDAPCAIAFLTDSAEPLRLDHEVLKKTYGLTGAEIRIAETLTECLGDKQIAEKLGLSSSTVRAHLVSIYDKTNVRSRTMLMRLLVSLSHMA